MRKLFCFLLVAGLMAGCSVESMDTYEDSATADLKAGTDAVTTTEVEAQGEFRKPNGKEELRGTIFVTNDCDTLYIEIVPEGNIPDEVKLGLFQEGDVFPKTNGEPDQVQEYEISSLEDLTWAFPLADFDTSMEISIFSKAWGIWTGDLEWGDKSSYFNYAFEELDCEEICGYGLGWWKNHSNDNPGNQEDFWSEMDYTLGGETYTQGEWNEIYDSNNRSGLVNFVQHLMTAKLNIALGVDDSGIANVILAADELLEGLVIMEDSIPEGQKEEFQEVKDAITTFNDDHSCEEEEEE